MTLPSRAALKELLGKAAAQLIQPGMLVGLGTGTTAACFIDHLIQRAQEGLKILCAATSEASYNLAKSGGLQMIDLNDYPQLDIAVDGADEIDPDKRMIKGAGGALLREKIIAESTRSLVIVSEATKLVPKLGKAPLPVEIVPFGYQTTLKRMARLGYNTKMRLGQNGSLYVTDNGNLIADVIFATLPHDLQKDHERLIQITGVVETGFFPGITSRFIIAYPDGRIEILEDLK